MTSQQCVQLLSSILQEPQIAAPDKVLLSFIATEQAEGRTVIHRALADLVDITATSVARRLRKLRERGFVECERVGKHAWEYLFVGFDVPASSEEMVPFVGDPMTLHPEGSGGSQVEENPAPPPPVNVYDLFTGERILLRKATLADGGSPAGSPLAPTQEDDVAVVTGPDSRLKEILEQKVANVGNKKRVSPKKDRFKVRGGPTNRWERFKAKKPSEYKVPDMEMLYKQTWEKEQLSGRPFSWTGKDQGQVKRMIVDQGAEAVAKLIVYVLSNWDKIKRRYRLTGTPSPAVIYGYRRSWMPEAIDGPPKEVLRGPAEWTGDADEDDELDETGWGGI